MLNHVKELRRNLQQKLMDKEFYNKESKAHGLQNVWVLSISKNRAQSD